MVRDGLIVITKRHLTGGRPLVEVVRDAAMAKPGAIILRERDLPDREYHLLASQCLEFTRPAGVDLLVSGRVDIARDAGAAGVHLSSRDLSPAIVRIADRHGLLVGVSVHNVDEARRAADRGVDYLLFGHVFLTASKAGRPPRGPVALKEVVAAVDCPVWALGGITAHLVEPCLAAGARGVAVMSAVMEATHPGLAVEELTRAMELFLERGRDKVEVMVNGQKYELPEAFTVERLLAFLAIDGRACAVELNGAVLPKQMWTEVAVKGGDRVELIRFVGGG